jgi:hypothetical protein
MGIKKEKGKGKENKYAGAIPLKDKKKCPVNREYA